MRKVERKKDWIEYNQVWTTINWKYMKFSVFYHFRMILCVLWLWLRRAAFDIQLKTCSNSCFFLLFVYNIIVKHDTNIIHVHIWIYNGNWFPKYHNNNMLDDALDAVRASWAIGLFTVVILPFWINLLVRIALARASSYLSLMNFVIRNFTHRTAVLFGCALLLADSSSKRSNKICIANTRTIAFVRCYARRMIWWCVAAIENVCYPYNNCIYISKTLKSQSP